MSMSPQEEWPAAALSPHRVRSERDLEFLARTLDGDLLSGLADVVVDYEHALAARFGSAQAVAVSSGTAALQAAAHAVGVRPGDAIILPAIAPLPTVLPFVNSGFRPVFVEAAPDRLAFDADDLAACLSGGRIAAAVTVSLWGYPFDLSGAAAEALAAAEVPIIEDAAHAHGATIVGRQAGGWANLSCFSTHDRKALSTGEGGFVLTDDAMYAESVRSYSRLGRLNGACPGTNMKLPALSAALGLARMPVLDLTVAARRANAVALVARLADIPWLTPLQGPEGASPSFYSLVLLAGRRGPALAQALACRGWRSDTVSFGYKVGYKHELTREYARPCPNAEYFVSSAIQIPADPHLTPELRERLVRDVRASAAEVESA